MYKSCCLWLCQTARHVQMFSDDAAKNDSTGSFPSIESLHTGKYNLKFEGNSPTFNFYFYLFIFFAI